MKTNLFSIFFFVLFSASTNAEEIEMFGVFSSFHKSPTSGDLIGTEIHVLPHPVVVIQGSEGHAGEPELFKAKILGNNILFKIPEKSMTGLPPGYYEATINQNKMILVGPRYKLELPRKTSYWE